MIEAMKGLGIENVFSSYSHTNLDLTVLQQWHIGCYTWNDLDYILIHPGRAMH